MSKKNFKVETAENGQTPKQDTKHAFSTSNIKKDKTPTGKVKTLKDKEKIQEERKEQYKNFRVSALKRRCERYGLTEEQTDVKVTELLKQLDTPNQYDVLICFNPNDVNLVKQALLKEDLVYKIMTSTYVFMIADSETLATIREIMPPDAKIWPYVKRKPSVLEGLKPEKSGRGKKTKTKAQKKDAAAEAKKNRKKAKLAAHTNHKEAAKQQKKSHNKKMRTIAKHKKIFDKRCLKASNKKSGTIVQLKAKKGSKSSKKASTLKKAA